MAFLKRLILVTTTGYILCFFSELYFFNDGLGFSAAAATAFDPLALFSFLFEMCFYYGCWAFIFLAAISYFRIRSIWALFLAGAIFGWLTEGTVVPVLYESVPGTILWPSLGWHALVDVLMGWFAIRMVLRANNPWLTLAVTIPLGLFWGIWATWFWQAEYPDALPPLDPSAFTTFSFTFGLLCVAAYAIQERCAGDDFQPTRWELGIVVAWNVFCFAVVVVPAYLYLAALLPLLLGVSCFALSRNRRQEKREDVLAMLRGRVDWINYAILCLMCPLASLSYAMMYHYEIRWPLAETLCPLLTLAATVMLLLSFVVLLKQRTTLPGNQSAKLGNGGDDAAS